MSPINGLTQNLNIDFRMTRRHQTFREIIFAKFCISHFREISHFIAKIIEAKTKRNFAKMRPKIFAKPIVCWKH